MLSKMGFAHDDLFKGHILYAERSLKLNNSIYWMLTLAQELCNFHFSHFHTTQSFCAQYMR